MTRPTSRSMAPARSAKASGARLALESVTGASMRPPAVRRPSGRPGWLVRGIEGAEVVAHVVLDRERDIAAIQGRLGVALEVGVNLLVGGQRAVVGAAADLVA